MDLSVAENYMKEGNFVEAQKEFRRLVFTTPTNARLHAYEGICFFRMNNFEAAIPCLKRAFDLDPKFVEAGIKLAQAYDKLLRYDEAYSVVQDCLTVRPGDATVQGLAYFLKDRIKGNRKDGWERSVHLESHITFAGDKH